MAEASSRAFVVGTKFPAEAPRLLVVVACVRGHTQIACKSEYSIGTVSTVLAVSVKAYLKRLGGGRPPWIGSFEFEAVFESRCPSTGGRWSAGNVSLFGPKGVVTERGLDGFFPSMLDCVMVVGSEQNILLDPKKLTCMRPLSDAYR